MHEDRLTDCDLILGLPALEVDAVGLSAIRPFTIYRTFKKMFGKTILDHQFTCIHR